MDKGLWLFSLIDLRVLVAVQIYGLHANFFLAERQIPIYVCVIVISSPFIVEFYGLKLLIDGEVSDLYGSSGSILN